MAGIGQAVYKLQDYRNNNEYITNLPSGKSTIYENIIPTGEKWNKIGIQADPGTYFYLGDKKIMMGRTGIYELDEDIEIGSLKFVRPIKYTLNYEDTQRALEEGKQAMQAAETARQTALNQLSTDDEDYWLKYAEIYKTYKTAMENANVKLIKGINGIYNVDESAEIDLYNVIIDYIIQ